MKPEKRLQKIGYASKANFRNELSEENLDNKAKTES